MDLDAFIAKWRDSQAAERANKDPFLIDLCDLLGVPRPDPTTGDPERDRYCFERDALFVDERGEASVGKIDLYKEGCFLLEAKQGSESGNPKRGVARRGTGTWDEALHKAFGQARGYASTLAPPPPFLVVCDIGHSFDLYAAFDGTCQYRHFPDESSSRIHLSELGDHLETLRAVFEDPRSLDPSRRAVAVTREVAARVARLARRLRERGEDPEGVATFLMRCLFTMFAEDVELLRRGTFTDRLRDWWIPSPESFPLGVRRLWKAMYSGTPLPEVDVRRFGGRLFANPKGIKLEPGELELLLEVAGHRWSEVDPAIFGTLLEQALDPKKRRRLGAHFTPRGHVERLVRPTVEEPLRSEWDVVQAEVRHLMERGRARDARRRVKGFHERLLGVTVLDPACGSGNFLYVTLEVLKRLEGEVLRLLAELGDPQTPLGLPGHTVTPEQLHGIEVEPWAREIAELVVWIGYLGWQIRTFGSARDLPDPVLRDYHNFECRDAVLEHDGERLVTEGRGVAVTRWDGETFRPHPVTGQPVPDEEARLPVHRLLEPRPAPWPEVELVVGNPPFVGNKRMRAVLGDEYVDALRAAYPEVPESADYVMYWWSRAAELVREEGPLRRFGLITTNSISQPFNRQVVRRHLEADPPLSLLFAVPDHPWVDSRDGAAVRIAMTVGAAGRREGVLAEVVAERPGDPRKEVELTRRRGRIHPDLTVGPDLSAALPLKANSGLCGQGIKVVGTGFRLDRADRPPEEPLDETVTSPATGAPVVRRMVSVRDVLRGRPGSRVIDFFGLDEEEARNLHPGAYQWLLTRVKPHRDQNRRRSIRELWWRFGWERPVLRKAIEGLRSYLVTPSTSKHRLFVRVGVETLWEGSLFAVALEDPFHFGVLSSRVHAVWALAAGGTLEDRPTWTSGRCFDPFPFPGSEGAAADRVRCAAEEIEAHRRRVVGGEEDGGLDLTALYNVVEAVRDGRKLSSDERRIHDRGLASLLAGLHDRLDEAVEAAYGWAGERLPDEALLERLVELNAQRAAEEATGRVHWLRPELQAPEEAAPRQTLLPGARVAPLAAGVEAPPAVPWPGELAERIEAVRELLATGSGPWSVERVARRFRHAPREGVAEILDALVALGLAVSHEGPEGRLWRWAAREVA